MINFSLFSKIDIKDTKHDLPGMKPNFSLKELIIRNVLIKFKETLI